jgi:hypothetical protein
MCRTGERHAGDCDRDREREPVADAAFREDECAHEERPTDDEAGEHVREVVNAECESSEADERDERASEQPPARP